VPKYVSGVPNNVNNTNMTIVKYVRPPVWPVPMNAERMQPLSKGTTALSYKMMNRKKSFIDNEEVKKKVKAQQRAYDYDDRNQVNPN